MEVYIVLGMALHLTVTEDTLPLFNSTTRIASHMMQHLSIICIDRYPSSLFLFFQIPFSFAVEWVHTPEIEYVERMKRYADSTFLPTTFEIHWLSIINSFVLVMLLTAFLAIILMRILKKDFSKYMEVDEVSINF